MTRTTKKNNPQLFERTHICGIGGIGMSGVAHLLLDLNRHVSGSDLRRSELTAQLESRGADIIYEPEPNRIQPASCVIAPMSFPQNHPEIQAAHKFGVPLFFRAGALARICSAHHAQCCLCFGTTARGKLPWMFHQDPEFGRCAGAAIQADLRHACFSRTMFLDVDEREFMANPDDFDAFYGSDIIISDWNNGETGYYHQKTYKNRYKIQPECFMDELPKRLVHPDAILIMPRNDLSTPQHPIFSAYRGETHLQTAQFYADPSSGLLFAPDEWKHSPISFFGTLQDAAAPAAALLWARCRQHAVQPSDTECIGWFHPVSDFHFHDIRMHPVNVQNALATLFQKAGSAPVGMAIKPFSQTLNGYDFEQWQIALKGLDRLLIITPPYEGCSEEICEQFATAMHQTVRTVRVVTKAQAHELADANTYWLWSGASDIL